MFHSLRSESPLAFEPTRVLSLSLSLSFSHSDDSIRSARRREIEATHLRTAERDLDGFF